MGENTTRLDKYAEAVFDMLGAGPKRIALAVMAVADAEQAELRAKVARVEALLADEPLIVSGIRRDMKRTPSGRGGELRSIPVTPGHGMSGCPGDNLTAWIDGLRAALSSDPIEGIESAEAKVERIEALAVEIERDASIWGNPRDLHLAPSAVRRVIVGRLRAALDGTN